jgi:hypothetical protein
MRPRGRACGTLKPVSSSKTPFPPRNIPSPPVLSILTPFDTSIRRLTPATEIGKAEYWKTEQWRAREPVSRIVDILELAVRLLHPSLHGSVSEAVVRDRSWPRAFAGCALILRGLSCRSLAGSLARSVKTQDLQREGRSGARLCSCIGMGAESSLAGFPSLAWLHRPEPSETLPRKPWFDQRQEQQEQQWPSRTIGIDEMELYAVVVTSEVCCIESRQLYGLCGGRRCRWSLMITMNCPKSTSEASLSRLYATQRNATQRER